MKVLKCQLLNQFKCTHSKTILYEFLKVKKEFKEYFTNNEKQYKNSLQNSLRNSLKSNNTSNLWKTVKSINRGGANYNTVNISPDVWFEYFKKLLNVVNNIDCELENSVNLAMVNHDAQCELCIENEPHAVNTNITCHEIELFIKNLSNNKAPGIDGIKNEMLKCCSTIILPYLLELFNSILEKGCYPTDWCKAIIMPLHKSGSVSNVDNYRGISLLSTISQIFTGIVNNRLSDWVEFNNIL
jgi:hypothetical protein